MFFDRLKALCDNQNISPYKVCEAIGLNRAAVAKWKKGSIPNGSTAAKLANYFGVTTDYLIGEDAASDHVQAVELFKSVGGMQNFAKENPPSRLEPTERESRILEALRSKSPAEQKSLLTLLGISED